MQLTDYDGQAGLVLKVVKINGKQALCVHARANLNAQNIPSSKVISYGLIGYWNVMLHGIFTRPFLPSFGL